MKDNQAKYPQLRFKGFTDPWVQRNLGEVVDVKSGRDYKHLSEGDIPVYGTGGYMLSVDEALSQNDDAIGIGRKGTIDNPYLLRAPFWTVDTLFYAIPRVGFDLNFTFDIFQKVNWRKLDESTGVPSLSKATINSVSAAVPSEDEQIKIGGLFEKIDNLIAANQRKLDLLKEQKKGYLQKMFPKNGEKVPELRFAGFADDWEQRKLGDVVGEIQSGNRLPKDSLTNGDVPYVVAQTKNDGVFTKIARGTLDYNGKPMKLFPGNSISFSIDNPEAMFYRNAEFYTSNIMRVIHEDHLTHEQYVFILENMKRFIRGYDWSRKFSGPVVSNLEYLQPSEKEQQKIGSFFKQLDNTITLHQRKLDLLKEQKKGFLQKMFA
ncbi:hypothetical protein AYR62_15890 (plasmid) [Secundilactobacillus paracollinoides]|uniref:restriction endonuclease subunit S n=1 Tax=Secundilactobacillus paracollinoides TaxID=240427 RepID=UPI00081A8E99|nr:restriction endonuclease subunit S [Secundilactobacillus paracollinoides]ANZ65566.1 hypothetical protein AYR62_15890 [Secundilactobacillus paracollinoides]